MTAMDTELEKQVDRVLYAFRKAANKHWGSEEPQKAWGPEKRTRAKSQPKPKSASTTPRHIKGDETQKQKQVREYLEQNPGVMALEASKATGVSYRVCKRVRAKLEKAKGTA